MSITVSVIVPVFNGDKYIKECLDSVLTQRRAPDDVIVIDDGSTDSTPAVLGFYKEKIRVIQTANQGVALSRNQGIKAAKGQYLAFLDADDRWHPDKLYVYEKEAEQHPESALFFSDAWTISSQGERQGLIHRPLPSGKALYKALITKNFVITSTSMIRADVVQAIGYFREDFKCKAGVEDWEFFLRVVKRFPATYIPKPLTDYRIHPASAMQTKRFDLKEDGLKALSFHMNDPGILPEEKSKASAFIHYWSGVRHLVALDIKPARNDFMQSLKNTDYFLKSFMFIILTLCGPGPTGFFLRLHRWRKQIWFRLKSSFTKQQEKNIEDTSS